MRTVPFRSKHSDDGVADCRPLRDYSQRYPPVSRCRPGHRDRRAPLPSAGPPSQMGIPLGGSVVASIVTDP